VLVTPSPKFHSQEVGSPVEASVNWTARGASPVVTSAVKAAVGVEGIGIGVAVGEGVGVGVAVGDGAGVGVAVGDGAGVGVAVGVGAGVAVGNGVGAGVAVGDGVGVGDGRQSSCVNTSSEAEQMAGETET